MIKWRWLVLRASIFFVCSPLVLPRPLLLHQNKSPIPSNTHAKSKPFCLSVTPHIYKLCALNSLFLHTIIYKHFIITITSSASKAILSVSVLPPFNIFNAILKFVLLSVVCLMSLAFSYWPHLFCPDRLSLGLLEFRSSDWADCPSFSGTKNKKKQLRNQSINKIRFFFWLIQYPAWRMLDPSSLEIHIHSGPV